ncbi:GAF domain-containing protein [Lacticaseibacillus saniviri]|uniref:Gaf domain-containing protein n=1 Tax=Lacticaseibacillus saniviri JCM 17471 = DSM 24301 TaxID=1293598 RepID=A0A0R2MYE6_9LACO|nr:GAF domain-containing protein [Lacticaseibacillus saniviri]KRO18404.1 gaf domain-containing protein [Lacticaseibacillus saniviri JCM 17471 = DSM 24301]MCG4281413.1 GAF domain-containing protein [Lacticaseibacillus saniviri]
MAHLDSLVVDQLSALLTDESNPITNLSNAAALLNDSLDRINWAGFYLYNQNTQELDLGPFQGKVACMHITPGSGVVGTSYQRNESIIVADVHQFAGHIACDAASNAEIVTPIVIDNQVVGIIDIDSPDFNRFDATDQTVLTAFAEELAQHLDVAHLAAIY